MSDVSQLLKSFATVQREFRELAQEPAPELGSLSPDITMDELMEKLAAVHSPRPSIGCRLHHWDPELEHFRVDAVCEGEPCKLGIYEPLDVRTGGRAHVFFHKLYKTRYAQPGQKRTEAPERQFGVNYSDMFPKKEINPLLDAFKRNATLAGELVASARDRLAPVLPAATLATKNDHHRWIFTMYDVAWRAPLDSPGAAMRYIPMHGLNAFMKTDESVLYDLDYLRSTPWSEVEARLDKNGWGRYSHFEECYSAWQTELPEYYASRLDDVAFASDKAIDWLVERLA